MNNILKRVKSIAKPIVKPIVMKQNLTLPHSSIYCLHHVEKNSKCCGGCQMSTAQFKEFAKSRKNCIDLNSLLEMLTQDNERVTGYTAITFDDGLSDAYRVAYPYLVAINAPFTLFISSRLVNTSGYINLQELKEMAFNPLVTIGVHGANHKTLLGLSKHDLEEEVIVAKDEIEQMLGKQCNIFAYPYGQYDSCVLDVVSKAGFDYALQVKDRSCRKSTVKSRFTIPRFNIESSTLKYHV
ncbi:polysaccharide deacetylase family protein [Clostridium sp. AWRP]|uniref:polysaccharide deacetylase family protein n=1 Tax=Clostridium sp. AWRP TaxID=2212991 RepID=UPI000FD792CC|nr:polysaccharide deacetylase family protein [Clostridium sp. AWRP]AZV55539.1 polysaccharide deacetylase family protein [Clostridium sp. AWRP]